MSYLTRAYYAVRLAAKANAPTLLVGGGVVSMGAGAVVACRKTLHLEDTISPHAETLEQIEHSENVGSTGGYVNKPYTAEMAREDRIKVYSRTGLDMAKLYAFPGTLFVGGAVMVFGGHRMMLQRNATLAIAFTSMERAFARYRARVVENYGSETDQAMANGWVKKEVIDPVTGKTAVINTRDWDEDPMLDPYNRVFEQGSTNQWVADLGVNKMFIQNQMRFAQERLNRQGHLYLSDVYEALGFPETDLSRVVGWKVRNKPDGSRDIPFVDFGLDKPHPDDWKYDRDRAIYLDFNCQGLIVGGKVQKLLEKA